LDHVLVSRPAERIALKDVLDLTIVKDCEFVVDNGEGHGIKKPDIFKIRMKHLIGRVSGVHFNYIDEIEPLMEEIATKCELTVVSRAFHQFEPFGVTGVLVLSESHFSVHTYPEKNNVYLDIFCCAEHFDPEQAGHIILSTLNGTSAEWQVVNRF
jgi:S-adenosylmethionine decarboxylase proenzyme